jgi:hypothetical protein
LTAQWIGWYIPNWLYNQIIINFKDGGNVFQGVIEAIALVPVSSFFFGLASIIIVVITITEPIWLPIVTIFLILSGVFIFLLWVLMTWFA